MNELQFTWWTFYTEHQWSGTSHFTLKHLLYVSHLSIMRMSRTDTELLYPNSFNHDTFFRNEARASSQDQEDTECSLSFLQSRREPRAQPISLWGSTHAEVSCQRPGEEGAVHWAPYPASLCLQPTHAHAIAPSLSGGCLDAVKSCF